MTKKPKLDRRDKFVYSEADIDALIKNPTDAELKQAQATNLSKPLPPRSS